MFDMLPCGVETGLKGIAEACTECNRYAACFTEAADERLKAGGFLAKVKSRLSASEERATRNKQPN